MKQDNTKANGKIFTKEEIVEQLKQLGAPQDGIVLIHTALRQIGKVEGGGQCLLDTFIEYFTAKGGLFCVPTHTPGNMLCKNLEISLDMADNGHDLGAFTTIALEDKRGIRSENPILSMKVFGDREKAQAFIKDDAFITSPTAPESCYGKLATQNGHILLVGVGQNKSTYLHAVAELLNLPDRMDSTFRTTKVRRLNGECVERKLRLYHCSKTKDVSTRFVLYEPAFRHLGATRDGYIGNAQVQLCDAKKIKESVALIFKNANGEDPLGTWDPIPPAWYGAEE